jgi:hypothetical protein
MFKFYPIEVVWCIVDACVVVAIFLTSVSHRTLSCRVWTYDDVIRLKWENVGN